MVASPPRRSSSLPNTSDLAAVRAALLGWYADAQRDFPWRRTRDPYAVLVSEVMLQQTQASRVAERFPRFMARFPNVDALAAAPASAVIAEWSGLGYNRRAIHLQRAALAVSRNGWPDGAAGLERLPGVGAYTARAVASLAFDIPVGVVDTNVRRWLLRRFGATDAPAALQSLADALAAQGRTDGGVAAWTHASMEFGAAICRSRTPLCESCPIADGCPSRGMAAVVRVARQAPLAGSDRAYRGALLRQLSSAARHRMTEANARGRIGPDLDDRRWRLILSGLERDGLLHRRDGWLLLGAATIGR